MNRLRQPVLALSLAICLLAIGSAAYPQIVSHTHQHSHHNAATHATVLCSWVCAAGQMVESPTVWANHVSTLLEWIPFPNFTSQPTRHIIGYVSRGPPA